MNNIADGSPTFTIRHKNHPFPSTSCFHHRLRVSAGIYYRPPVDQFLDSFARIQPYESCCPRSGSEYLAVLFRPPLHQGDNVVLHLIERLIDDGPSSNVGRETRKAGIASQIPVESVDGDNQEKYLRKANFCFDRPKCIHDVDLSVHYF